MPLDTDSKNLQCELGILSSSHTPFQCENAFDGVLARETTIMYNIFLFNLLLSVILSVTTLYINCILDVELCQGAGHLYSTF